MKRILICGTGRNGSTSMYELLKRCKNVRINHFCPVKKETSKSSQGNCKYDISISPLTLGDIREKQYDKAIFLYRSSGDVIDSFIRSDKDRKKEEIEEYVGSYYFKAAYIKNSGYENFEVIDVELLNSYEGQKQIFDFLGIDEEDRNYMEECHFNGDKS